MGTVKVLPYDLPDGGLPDGGPAGGGPAGGGLPDGGLPDGGPVHGGPAGGAGSALKWIVYAPRETAIVLGKSNREEEELFTGAVLADCVPVFRRSSGGHAVLLSPRTAVVAFAVRGRPALAPRRHFRLFNGLVAAALARLGVAGVVEKGFSDLVLGEKKIAGSSLHLSSRYAFYHAVVNLSEDPALIARYLRMPPREPDYRRGRPHGEFVTSLAAAGYGVAAADLAAAVSAVAGEAEGGFP